MMSEPVKHGQVTEWPQSLVWALYDTPTGAAEGLEAVQTAEKELLLTTENVVVIVKDAAGNVTVQETEDPSAREGNKNNILLGALASVLTPGTAIWQRAATPGSWLDFRARLHDAGFDDDTLRAVVAAMPPHSSALLALITNQWLDDLLRYFHQSTTRLGWIIVTRRMAKAVERARA